MINVYRPQKTENILANAAITDTAGSTQLNALTAMCSQKF
jgi:hypothetical protein